MRGSSWTSVIVLVGLHCWSIRHLGAFELYYALTRLSFWWRLSISSILSAQAWIFTTRIVLHSTILFYNLIIIAAWVSFEVFTMEVLIIILAIWVGWPILIRYFRILWAVVVRSHTRPILSWAIPSSSITSALWTEI